jgi:hypothetical protein
MKCRITTALRDFARLQARSWAHKGYTQTYTVFSMAIVQFALHHNALDLEPGLELSVSGSIGLTVSYCTSSDFQDRCFYALSRVSKKEQRRDCPGLTCPSGPSVSTRKDDEYITASVSILATACISSL